MMRRIARITIGRTAMIALSLLLALAGLAALPAGPASASSPVESWWTPPSGGGSTYENTYPCTAYQYGVQGKPIQVDNNCGTRVWLHYDDIGTGRIHTFCVDPGGGFAYGFGYPSSDIQVTSNTSQCDSSATFDIYWEATSGLPNVVEGVYSCHVGRVETKAGFIIEDAYNGCDTRMWLHEYANGSGSSLCMSTGVYEDNLSTRYGQVQSSYNQVGCSGGSAPH